MHDFICFAGMQIEYGGIALTNAGGTENATSPVFLGNKGLQKHCKQSNSKDSSRCATNNAHMTLEIASISK
jgi:hypothetical protein